MSRPENEYVLGTDAVENARLGLQHRLWSAAAHEAWERARLRPGLTVLDVGCGPGYAALDLAVILRGDGTSPGRVIAIDESRRFLDQLEQAARARGVDCITTVCADVQHLDRAPELAPASADGAYARWVFCFLKDPGAVVRHLARVVKPGGRLVVQDYFNYESMTLAPRREIFTRIVKATGESWRANGGDPDVIGRLVGLCRQTGFEVEHLDVRQRIARPGTMLWAWPDTWWRSFVPRLVAMGFITEAERAEFLRMWEAASADPDCFAMAPPVFDLIARRL